MTARVLFPVALSRVSLTQALLPLTPSPFPWLLQAQSVPQVFCKLWSIHVQGVFWLLVEVVFVFICHVSSDMEVPSLVFTDTYIHNHELSRSYCRTEGQ